MTRSMFSKSLSFKSWKWDFLFLLFKIPAWIFGWRVFTLPSKISGKLNGQARYYDNESNLISIASYRNNILHGRQSAEDVKPDNLIKFEDLIRQSIRKFLNISKNFSDSKLSQNEKSKKSDPRGKILEELDMGLINPTRFQDFSKITTGIFD